MSVLDPRFIMARWPLTGVSVDRLFPGYKDRYACSLQADQGAFLAKVDPGAPPEELHERLYVLEYLADRRFEHAPSLIRARDGGRLVHVGGQSIWLMEFIPEPFPEGGRLRELSWREVGQAMARLNAYRDYPVPFGVTVSGALAELERRIEGQPFQGQFRDLLSRLEALAGEQESGLVHGEINPVHLKRRADGSLAFLDWDQAGTGPLFLDYGYPLIGVFLSVDGHVFERRCAAAFYQGYQEQGGKVDRERAFLSAVFHACRYMFVADTEARWQRILRAIEREDELCSVIA
jgi:hypothetical protein